MSVLYGGVYDYGFGFATNPAEMRHLMEAGKNVAVLPFENELAAFKETRKEYVKRGFAQMHRLIPQLTLEVFNKYKFYGYSACSNNNAQRFFATYNDQIYAILDSVEIASSALFAPNTAFRLKEFNSKDEAFNEIFMYYAVQGGVQIPYCNGAPLPVISNAMRLNVFYPSPLPKFFQENLRLPENLQQLGPYYNRGNQNYFDYIL